MIRSPSTVMLILLAAAPVAAVEPELTRRQAGDLAIQSRAILSKYCGECHKEGSGRSSLSVLDHKQLVNLQSPVPFASRSAGRSQILEFLEDGSMPPAGHDRPNPVELAILQKWIGAHAPSYPQSFDSATTQRILLEDLAGLPQKDRPFARYLSMAHLVPAGTEPPNLKAAEFALQKALAAATETAPPPPVPVDDSATLFRLDIRTLGWHTPDLFEKVVEQAGDGVFPMNAFDLILLEYPDAIPVAGPDAPRVKQALDEMKQLRPIPFLKADWFSDALLYKGKPTPLAEDLKQMILLAAAREKKNGDRPAGKSNEEFATRKSIRAAIPPLAAFYPKDVSTPTPPFPKLTLEVIDSKGETLAQVETDEQFVLKLSPDADGYFFLLMRWSNGEFGVHEFGGGNKLTAGKTRILTPKKAGAFRITGLLNGRDTGTEHFILLASPDEILPPTIVRSLHGESPIWRFLPAEPAKPGTLQRVVTPIEVKKR